LLQMSHIRVLRECVGHADELSAVQERLN